MVEAYRKVVDVLPRFQVEAGRDLNYKVCYPRASFDRQSIAWDLNYFKYYFLRLAGVPFNEQALEDDFSRLTKFLLSADRDYFLYRDFQSRNVMLREGEPYFLDYQGGRKGALQYDIASLLFDGKADLPPELRQHLLDHYLDCAGRFHRAGSRRVSAALLRLCVCAHHAGAGRVWISWILRAQAHFLQSVPYALKNLRWLLHNVELPIALPALMEASTAWWLGEAAGPGAGDAERTYGGGFSFSFHRGVPQDEAETGEDLSSMRAACRIPGARSASRRLTGKDAAVIEYLESAGERASVSGERDVAGGRQRERVSAARLQAS